MIDTSRLTYENATKIVVAALTEAGLITKGYGPRVRKVRNGKFINLMLVNYESDQQETQNVLKKLMDSRREILAVSTHASKGSMGGRRVSQLLVRIALDPTAYVQEPQESKPASVDTGQLPESDLGVILSQADTKAYMKQVLKGLTVTPTLSNLRSIMSSARGPRKGWAIPLGNNGGNMTSWLNGHEAKQVLPAYLPLTTFEPRGQQVVQHGEAFLKVHYQAVLTMLEDGVGQLWYGSLNQEPKQFWLVSGDADTEESIDGKEVVVNIGDIHDLFTYRGFGEAKDFGTEKRFQSYVPVYGSFEDNERNRRSGFGTARAYPIVAWVPTILFNLAVRCQEDHGIEAFEARTMPFPGARHATKMLIHFEVGEVNNSMRYNRGWAEGLGPKSIEIGTVVKVRMPDGPNCPALVTLIPSRTRTSSSEYAYTVIALDTGSDIFGDSLNAERTDITHRQIVGIVRTALETQAFFRL